MRTVEVGDLSPVLSAGEEVDEQVVRVFREEEEVVSSAWREVWELEASELDPEKNEGVTFLWRRMKFMEGNPRRVLGFWAGVEGFELKWIMAGRGGGWESGGALSSILIYHRSKSRVMMTAQRPRRRNHQRFINPSSRRTSEAPKKP